MVTRVLPAEGRVIVEGVNIAKKHQKKRRQTMQAGIIDKDMPIPVSNVAVVSPGDGKPTRVGYRFDDNGNKVRICKRTGADLS
jgi:large subunit ribosomal protein L24